jgi:hypothetical protein
MWSAPLRVKMNVVEIEPDTFANAEILNPSVSDKQENQAHAKTVEGERARSSAHDPRFDV